MQNNANCLGSLAETDMLQAMCFPCPALHLLTAKLVQRRLLRHDALKLP